MDRIKRCLKISIFCKCNETFISEHKDKGENVNTNNFQNIDVVLKYKFLFLLLQLYYRSYLRIKKVDYNEK